MCLLHGYWFFLFLQHQVELYNRAFVLTRNTYCLYQNSVGAHQRLGTRCELGEAWSQKQDLKNTRYLPTSRHWPTQMYTLVPLRAELGASGLPCQCGHPRLAGVPSYETAEKLGCWRSAGPHLAASLNADGSLPPAAAASGWLSGGGGLGSFLAGGCVGRQGSAPAPQAWRARAAPGRVKGRLLPCLLEQFSVAMGWKKEEKKNQQWIFVHITLLPRVKFVSQKAHVLTVRLDLGDKPKNDKASWSSSSSHTGEMSLKGDAACIPEQSQTPSRRRKK